MSDPDTEAEEVVEMPASTAWPLVLAVGVALLAIGVATSAGFLFVGVPLLLIGLGGWIGQLLPGQGRVKEALREASQRPAVPAQAPGTVEALRPGAAGYRFRLPEHVHPLSSGVKGGIVGGLLMPIPALVYGQIAHQSIWLPINLLVGMVIPGSTDVDTLRAFHPVALILGIVIHAAFSVTFGLMYGVILPMLPAFRGSSLLFGGVLMPIFWTGACYSMMGIVNPALEAYVSWRWFIASQFVYGLAMSYVVFRSEMIAVAQPHTEQGDAPI